MLNEKEILALISLKQEGPYWDFKRQWYDNGHEGDLLHDIICMSNNLVNRDCYIIIGIDEANDYAPFDITTDPNRRNTQNIVDFLRDKSFAGDVRPVVTVEHLSITGSIIDVVTIHNSSNTPFFLRSKFRQLHPNNIYTRVQDTNTPVDRSADISNIEYLWKKRFGIILTPLNRIQILLRDKSSWNSSPAYECIQYNIYAPEYTIKYYLEDPENRSGYEFYLLNQTDRTPRWSVIELRYHQTILKQLNGVFLDGGRLFSPCPNIDGFSFDESSSWDISYRFFVKDSLDYIVHEFYFDKNNSNATWANQRFLENILLFENEYEHKKFRLYVFNNWHRHKQFVNEIHIPYLPSISGYNMDAFKEQIKNTQILQNMLLEFRNAVKIE